MRNPTYAEDFQSAPMPETAIAIDPMVPAEELPTFFMGIKTITHNRGGLKLHPHKVIAIEMRAGNELASFDLNARWARHYATRLMEFADAIDPAKAA